MLVYSGNVHCLVAQATQNELWALWRILTVRVNTRQDYEEIPFWSTTPDGHTLFLAGFTKYVDKEMRALGFFIHYVDQRTMPTFESAYPEAHSTFEPYIDQAEQVEHMLKQTRGVLHLATGFGKTFLMSYFWHRAQNPSMLVVVPTKALLVQTSKDIEDQAGLPEGSIGRVGSGCLDWKPTTVAVVNSLDRWLEKHGSFPIKPEILFVDEGHKGVGDMHARVAQHMDSFYRFWMSGTAYKAGDIAHEFRLTGLAGSCIGRITNKQLVDWGRSKEPIIRFIDHQMEHRVDLEDDDFHGQYNLLVEDELRNQTIVNTAREAVSMGLTVLIFVEHTRHQRLLENMGMRDWCSFVQGGNNSRNERIKEQLKRGEIACACATSAWREGVSISNIDVLIQGGGKKAWTAKGQDFGRLLRQSELGFGYYFDFYDHGPPMLSRHSQSRMDSLRKEGFGVTIVRDTQNLFSRDVPEGSTDELGQPSAGSIPTRRITFDGEAGTTDVSTDALL